MSEDSIAEAIRARIAERIVAGPFGRHVGFTLFELEVDRAVVRLPFAAHVANGASIVHGGCVAALIDTAGTAAAWAHPSSDEHSRGTTVGLNVNFMLPGLESDLFAEAKVISRGRSICIVAIDVVDDDGRHVSRGTVTYRLRRARSDESSSGVLSNPDGPNG
jgi:uncharacterized protein (TIGR00369 family)